MKKWGYIVIFLTSAIVFSLTFIFQLAPGYMDAEYYYLGGKYLAEGVFEAPFIWNYLDFPRSLPHPLFSYWMPLASVVTSIPMLIFGRIDFQLSRLLFLLLASCIPPFTAYFTFRVTRDKFSSLIAALFAIFCGFYLKFLTIPETVNIYILLGGLFFFVVYLIDKKNNSSLNWKQAVYLGVISGLMNFSRVDGILFLVFSLLYLCFVYWRKRYEQKESWLSLFKNAFFCIAAFLLTLAPVYLYNYLQFGSISSPTGIKAIWIQSYDDTFIYPPELLSMGYWISSGLGEKVSNIGKALLMNFGTFSGVQMSIIGIPLIMLGFWRKREETLVQFFALVSCCLFVFMSVVFPLAGMRGGYLHLAASVQIANWVLMAVGFSEFINWGIRKRKWKLLRSQKMFGGALAVFLLVFTAGIYYRDVIGNSAGVFTWNRDYAMYTAIEELVSDQSNGLDEAIIINNPVGYHYQTGRSAIVLPNTNRDGFEELVDLFDVKFLVTDQNLPIDTKDYINQLTDFEVIGSLEEYEIKIYQYVE